MYRNRILYFVLIVFTIIVGLASRYFACIPAFVGDILWALMVFFGFAFLFRNKSSKWIALVALLFSYCIEISQLYHAHWIDAIRSYKLGGLILGFGFLWSDLLCYMIGIGLGYFIELSLLKSRQK